MLLYFDLNAFLSQALQQIRILLLSQMQRCEIVKMKDFEIIKELGCGSYGRVQLVKRKQDQKYYALKSMFLANAKQKQKDSALNQIRLLASITMPYVISYKSSFYIAQTQTLCIIMEYADGGDLQHLINQRTELYNGRGFEERFIWKTAFHLLKGLKGLHQHNIIHRDLKCANIFFVRGVAKIGDLNISKLTENGFASTQTGTPYYTSPEIWKGQKYDNKCDIWALGCIIYEMCTLVPPFRAEDFPGLYQAISAGQYVDIPSSYTKNLKDFISLCLKVSPLERPSAAALLQKTYFAQYELSIEMVQTQLGSESKISIIDPIQCPKVLKFLNERLPKSKFEQNSKKTVCFVAKQVQSSTSFKIKTKKIKSQKSIVFENDQSFKEEKEDRRVPKFLANKSNIKLPPLEKQEVKSIKSTHKLPTLKSQSKSMKSIPLKQNQKVAIK